GRERLDHADVVTIIGGETCGNAQVAVRDVVEQFVTGHFGSSRFFGPQGVPSPEATLPPGDHIGNRAPPASDSWRRPWRRKKRDRRQSDGPCPSMERLHV